jgi:energy-coupling factor transport system substrate-specific component
MTWIAASTIVLAVALAGGFAWYEREHPTTRVIALVAALAALAALGRVAFAPLPNVKPTTDIVLLAGYVLGGAPGFVVGAVAALASNLFFGQGPWTPWQMVAWGGCGLAGAGLARLAGRELGRVPLAAACGVAGLAFGTVMNVSLWVTYSGDHTAAKLAAVSATSLPFDVAHAVGNVVFCLAFGPALAGALRRFRTRMHVTWLPAPAAGAVIAALVLAGAVSAPPRATADATAVAARSSTSYLLKAQNPDGGWGAAPGAPSTSLHTGWAALGLAAAGRNPLDVGARSPIAYTRAHAGAIADLGSLARTILVFSAAGASTRNVGGRDLVAALAAKRAKNGSFAGRVNTTAFAILALRAAGGHAGAVRSAGRWLAGQANADGGYNFAGRGGPSGVDDTGAAVQGLAAAGRRATKTARRAAAFIAGHQNADGGFPLVPGAGSNAQSTAWAIQGLLAAGRDPATVHHDGSRDPLAYLRSLTAPSGEVRYSRTSRQTPVWVTGQALMALARKPLPLTRVARAARPAAAAPAPAPAATATPAPAPRAPKPRAAGRATPAPARATPAPTPVPAATSALALAAFTSATDPAKAHRAGLLAGLAAALI